ncbi:exodeoxyribonuclease VII small subunit [Paenibacillus sp. F411]|uniref:Exodeoxyribonuclease 7 small subunit n=1 Tax=Paenibacillus algicola TaxID=2565926 RepID=A0A4P8XJM7_9BACL|nr:MULTISPECIES: exodeoxyribonuclease VII small subunit [Paenibacillus]MBO2945109.1 exodeoxyribonuclease VII small subunit [Paenibacillus sp. F411]QCT02473.1 exodeoxyribonuclease VII, small subunit [Paenibacillus algicola]
MSSEAEMSFEEAMEQLELIVGQLEDGDVPLEKAIDLYQKGMKLSQLCSQKLEQVEQKIEMVVEEGGEVKRRPFGTSMEESGELE